MQKKVLFFSYWYPGKGNQNYALFVKRHAHCAAALASVQVLAVNISRQKVLFKFYSEKTTDEKGLTTHTLYFQSVFYKLLYVLLPLHYLFIKPYVKKHIRPNFSFNGIHCNILFPCAIVGHWLASHFSVPYVITEHWSKIDKFFRVSLYKHAGKKALNKARAISCVSQHLANTVKRYTHNTQVHIVPNVVDTDTFYYKPDLTRYAKLTFLAVAHWSPPKNPFYFTEALQQLSNKQVLPPFQLHLVGTGPLADEIKRRNYTFEIVFKGNLSPADLSKEMNSCHLFLHGSDFETFSVVIAEALASGLPCVVSPVGIAREVITEDTGCIAGNDPKDWEKKISKCVGNSYSNLKISTSVKEMFSQNTVARAFKELYETLN